MTHDAPSPAPLDDLAWQYVSDELSDDARHAFEALLADDQAAREALASAVELALASRIALEEDAILVAQREALTHTSARGWWSVLLAASAVLLLALSSQMIRRWQSPPAGSDKHELAIAWSEARTTWPTTALRDLQDDDEATGDDELIDLWAEELPTWMLAAVSESDMTMSESEQGDTVPE